MNLWFGCRFAFGLLVLAALLARDLLKPIRTYARAKEYGFLFGTAALAIGYGVVHDRVTYAISSEYYEVWKALPSAASGFSREVVMLAVKASWTVGLLVGLVFLIANGPSARFPQLPYAALARALLAPLTVSIISALLLGSMGFLFSDAICAHFGLDELELRASARFCTTWFIHIGTYLGALAGTVAALVRIRRLRRVAPRSVAPQ